MKICRVLESIFGSPARVNILRVLFNSPQPLSGRQVGELAGLTHRGAIQALIPLVELDAVKQRKVGKSYQYSLPKGNIFIEKIIIPCIKAEAGLFDNLKRDISAHFGKDASASGRHVSMVIAKKNLVEYEERLITQTEARDMTEHAKRFLEWVIGMLPKAD